MSKPIITMIHTVFPIVNTLTTMFKEKLEDEKVIIYNIVDDSILPRITSSNGVSPKIIKSIYQHISVAEEIGSSLILVTCSSISEVVDIINPLFSVPVVKIDDAMTDEAIRIASTLGVVATINTTLNPTIGQLNKKALLINKDIKIVPLLCSEAYHALINENDSEKHDLLLFNSIKDLIKKVDAIVLSQASMARILPKIKKITSKPILTSPESGIVKAINIMKNYTINN
ncbi:MAG: aspartate/glutamate racemase family protein [Eubacteriales bacterium]